MIVHSFQTFSKSENKIKIKYPNFTVCIIKIWTINDILSKEI